MKFRQFAELIIDSSLRLEVTDEPDWNRLVPNTANYSLSAAIPSQPLKFVAFASYNRSVVSVVQRTGDDLHLETRDVVRVTKLKA